MDDPQRHAVDVNGRRRLKFADHKANEVGRHLHGVGELDSAFGAHGGGPDLRGIRYRHQGFSDHERDPEYGLVFRLVPARKSLPGVGGLHLGAGNRLERAVVGLVRAGIETGEAVVEHAGESCVQLRGAGRHCDRQREGHPFLGRLESRGDDLDPTPADHHMSRADGQLFGVTGDRSGRFVHHEGDRDGARERSSFEVGLQNKVVAGGGYGPGQPVGVIRHDRHSRVALSPREPRPASRYDRPCHRRCDSSVVGRVSDRAATPQRGNGTH